MKISRNSFKSFILNQKIISTSIIHFLQRHLMTQSKVAGSFLSQKHDFSKFLKSAFEYFQLHFITYPTNISHWLYKISFLKTSCDFYRKHRKNHVKKNNTSIWDIFLEKAQHGDLDMINRHPSMFLFFPFSMFWVLGVFF